MSEDAAEVNLAQMKVCRGCGSIKPAANFGLYRSTCHTCRHRGRTIARAATRALYQPTSHPSSWAHDPEYEEARYRQSRMIEYWPAVGRSVAWEPAE